MYIYSVYIYIDVYRCIYSVYIYICMYGCVCMYDMICGSSTMVKCPFTNGNTLPSRK